MMWPGLLLLNLMKVYADLSWGTGHAFNVAAAVSWELLSDYLCAYERRTKLCKSICTIQRK